MASMGFSIYYNTYDIYSKGELSLNDMYQVVSLKKKLSECPVEAWKWMDNWPFRVKQLRDTKSKFIKERQLPAVIFFAATSPDDRKVIKTQSGYFGIDLDYADNKVLFDNTSIAIIKKMVAGRFGCVCLMFISPSGKGLKVVHRINPQGYHLGDHGYVSRKVFEYFENGYRDLGVNIDFKCKDWNRLCYLSYDREAYCNESAMAEVITIPEMVIQPQPVLEDGDNGYQLSSNKRDKDQICPQCNGGRHRDRSFTFYVDQNGTKLEGCGVCSRSKCNANIKPRELYPNVRWKYLGRVRS